MRLDLVVNTMFMTAVNQGEIVIHHPRIWRPILSIRDAVQAYLLALEAPRRLTGVFNIASGNYTVGAVARQVKRVLDKELGTDVRLQVQYRRSYRNYKVSVGRARRELGFAPHHSIADIVMDLLAHRDAFPDTHNPSYYNIEAFKSLFP